MRVLERLRDAPGFLVVPCSGEVSELLAACGRHNCCIAIMEPMLLLSSTPSDGSRLAGHPVLRVISRVDESVDSGLREQLVLLGCVALLEGNCSFSSVMRIIRAVVAGRIVVSRAVLERAFQKLLSSQVPRPSRREHEILKLLAYGLGNRAIAERLFISPETLRWHLRHLYAKTGMRTRTELQNYAHLTQEEKARSEASQEAALEPEDEVRSELV